MQLQLFQVDAFAGKAFEGNPAAVCPLEAWLPTEIMQSIALENNLSETAFFVPNTKGFEIRWFTPAIEVDLCGHATLASAHVLFHHLGYQDALISFDSRSGLLEVERVESGYTMDFPTDIIEEQSVDNLHKAVLGVKPLEAWSGKDDLMLVLGTETDVLNLKPDFQQMKQIPTRGVIATAPGDKADFISRCFFPNAGIDEDPVTGSAHTTLIPYWSEKLGKKSLKAKQVSDRGGNLICQMLGNRVKITGTCVTYLEGTIQLR
ncbi:MAG: PhzF family phenazine biosynthesis protein [Saprospiraceae bacterium]|nr:PhzF family phenazine biosynthesis protein [Saprospiraceae bacterium]